MKKIYFILPILAGILFGSCGIFVRVLTQNGMDTSTLLFSRFSISIIIMLIFILATDKNMLRISSNELKIIIIAAINILALNLCYTISTNTVPLSLAAVFLSLAPLFVIIFAYIAFKEKITSKKIISMILIIIGCSLTTGLLEGNVFNIGWIGILAGIGTAFFWANYNIASKKILKDGTSTYTLLFYTIIMMTIILIPFTNFNQITTFINRNTGTNIIFLIFNALLTFILPYVLLTESLNYIDAGSVAILAAGAEPLAALFFGITLYDEIPTMLIFIGIVMTIIAITILSKEEYGT
ncbi:DMT family transporter [uncultured Methanobrevibacter sp.]|uniref:DMT family transporter n=1 Tax=uncultured Methanobrevibacter sp. TaxID=253161 RepID=UPI0025FFA72A|nr:DMT family transporter [uncultured Methanobrevibacter sp.]